MTDNFDYGFLLRKSVLLAFISMFYWIGGLVVLGVPAALIGGWVGISVVIAVVPLLVVAWVIYIHGHILEKKE